MYTKKLVNKQYFLENLMIYQISLLKEKVTPKGSYFCLCQKQANIQLFHSPKFQPLKCPLSWGNLSRRKDFGGCHFETVLAARPCLCHVIPFDSKLAGRAEKNLQLTWHPSQGHDQQNLIFSKWLSTSLSSMLSFWSLEHVLFKIM